MTTLALPNMMGMIAPVALLVAVIHTLNRLSGDSELIVLTASGASTWTVARPLLVLGVAGRRWRSRFVNHVAMPWSLKLLRDYVIQVRSDLIGQVIQPGRFSSPESGLTFHIRERALERRAQGPADARHPRPQGRHLLPRGDRHADQAGRPAVPADAARAMCCGAPSQTEPPQIIEFQSYVVDLDRFEPKTGQVELKPRERYFQRARLPRADDPDFKRQPGHFRAELHERFANPFYSLRFRAAGGGLHRPGSVDPPEPLGGDRAGRGAVRRRRASAGSPPTISS